MYNKCTYNCCNCTVPIVVKPLQFCLHDTCFGPARVSNKILAKTEIPQAVHHLPGKFYNQFSIQRQSRQFWLDQKLSCIPCQCKHLKHHIKSDQ